MSKAISKVSVIVPVYNVEPYIEKCIQSVQNQTLLEFECLIIDDASPDNSIARIQPFIENDVRFRIIRHRKNQGLGSARNTGIDHATAEYICFIDSDDYVEPDYLNLLYNAVTKNNADMAICATYDVYNNSKTAIIQNAESQTWQDAVINKLTLIDTNSAPFRIIRKQCFANIRFPQGQYEDSGVLLQLIVENKIAHIPYVATPLYNYIHRTGSIMSSKITPRKIHDYVHNTLYAQYNIVIQNKFLRNNIQKIIQVNIFINIMNITTKIYVQSQYKYRNLKFLARLVNNEIPAEKFNNILHAVFQSNRVYKFYKPKNLMLHSILYILSFKCGYVGILCARVLTSVYLVVFNKNLRAI